MPFPPSRSSILRSSSSSQRACDALSVEIPASGAGKWSAAEDDLGRILNVKPSVAVARPGQRRWCGVGGRRLIRTDPQAVAPERAATGWVVGKHFCVEVGEDLLDNHRVLDTSDDPQRPAAGRTGLDVDAKKQASAAAPWLSNAGARRETASRSTADQQRARCER